MAVPRWQLNRFERVLFWAAIVLGGVLVAARLGAVIVLTFVKHSR